MSDGNSGTEVVAAENQNVQQQQVSRNPVKAILF